MSNSAGGEKSSRLRGTLRYTGPSAPPAPQPEPPLKKGGRGRKRKSFCLDRLPGARSQIFGGVEQDR